jgi:hypothetical protein
VLILFNSTGLVDEVDFHVASIIIGNGVRLFENIQKDKFSFEIIDVINSPTVTHLKYKVVNHG